MLTVRRLMPLSIKGATMWFFEMLIGVYCLANWAIYITMARPVLSIFLAIYAIGFLGVGWMSRPEANFCRRLVFEEEPARQPATSCPRPVRWVRTDTRLTPAGTPRALHFSA